MPNSKRKGKRGELEWCHKCREHGFEARRGQQFSGNPDSPDVIVEGLDSLHFEIKLQNRMQLYDWMDQALRDCGLRTPVVAHRKDNAEWLVTMRADAWFDLVREALGPEGPELEYREKETGQGKNDG